MEVMGTELGTNCIPSIRSTTETPRLNLQSSWPPELGVSIRPETWRGAEQSLLQDAGPLNT